MKTVFGTNGGIYAIRKSLYQYLPENTMVSDDFLIPIQVIKQGFDVIFEKKAIGRETITRTIRDEFARRIRISVGYFNDLKEIRSLLVPRLTFVSFGLWSHKILRWFAPFLLILLFVSNLLIIDSIFFNIVLIIQIVFYSISFIGFVLGRIQKVKNIALVSYCYYFASQNLALLIGFLKSLLKSQKPIWEKVERDILENNLMI